METPIASADRGHAAGPAGPGRSDRSATGAQARARPGLPRFLSARCRGAERASGKLGGRRGLRPLLALPAPEGWPLRLHPARPCRDRRRSLRLPGDRRREPEALDLEGVRVPGDVAPVTRVIRPDLRVRRRVSAHDLEPVSRRRWIDVARYIDRPDPEYVPALVQVLEPPRRAASLVALAIQLAPESRAGVIGDEPELDPPAKKSPIRSPGSTGTLISLNLLSSLGTGVSISLWASILNPSSLTFAPTLNRIGTTCAGA